MFRKLIKKLKKKSVYWRIAIVYIIFLIVKWFMYEIAGIEIGKEGFREGSASQISALVSQIQTNAGQINQLYSQQNVQDQSNSAGNEQAIKLAKTTCDTRVAAKDAEIQTLKHKLSSKCTAADCGQFACVQKKLN